EREEKALQAIASVGLISYKQLVDIFGISAGLLKSMEKTHKLIPHTLIKNKNTKTKIYTLGVKGAMAIKLDNYQMNYWVRYVKDDILKKLLFFQMYRHLSDFPIIPVPNPFIGAIENNDALIYVYVMKGNTSDLMRYLKFQSSVHHRIILVAENIQQLKSLELYFKELKVRIALESDLINGNTNKNIFYH